jgi:hypothetical protein
MNTLLFFLLLSPFHPFTLAPCLLQRVQSGELDKVLTPAVIAQVLPSRGVPTKKYITKYVPADYQLCQYSWKGARETSLTVNGQTTVVTKPDIVALGNVHQAPPVDQRPKFPAIDIPGKTAVWDSTNSELIVYEGATQYSVRVDINNDVKANQKVAVEIAERLRCE